VFNGIIPLLRQPPWVGQIRVLGFKMGFVPTSSLLSTTDYI